ncbi:hypothetical protein RHGRI_013105 [Rhododendron griersonianum]|uniref:ATP synthase F0 subunit 8 n=1 Tax=Rhododendron griersonianum TaxID=479676 RepID=A0AAV6K4L3_9ERIC|nr:hypothetical protein RHGRI_013105 [Rhododendron griersonianum]
MFITNIELIVKNEELIKLLTHSQAKEWWMKVIVLMLVFIIIAMCWQIVKGESNGKNGHLLYDFIM